MEEGFWCGGTLATQVRVGVVPGILVILEHVQASWLGILNL